VKGSEMNVVVPDKVTADLNHYLLRYSRYAWCNAILFWITRLVSVVGAVILPFVLKTPYALYLSIAIAVSVSLDTIYKPAINWKLFSDAYDELFLEKAKIAGAYAAAPSVYDRIKQIESRVSKGRDQLDQLIKDAKSSAQLAIKRSKTSD